MSLDLCKGIAVVIDDKALSNANDEIVKIIKKIKADNMPVCIYTDLANAQKAMANFNSVSFLILDWDMQGQLQLDNEDAAAIIKPSQANRVIRFIREFKKICFCPIFVFSNAAVVDIKSSLKEHDLFYEDDRKNFIHVQAKRDLVKGKKLFTVINKWISSNPNNYTLKNWENSFIQAKTDSFWHLFSKSPVWPKVMWESFTEDSIDPVSNLNDVIYRLIKSRTSLTDLDPRKINRRKFVINDEEIKDVIQGVMYIGKENIQINEARPGDIYKKSGSYYINIRPECDTIIGRTSSDSDVKIYLLKGEKVSPDQFRKNHYNKKYGIIKNSSNFLLYGLDGRDFIRFNFREMSIVDYKDYVTFRLSRLLSPYINDVQQQFSSYIGRFGLPRLPNRILKGAKKKIVSKESS